MFLFKIQIMLVVDSFATLLTWLPFNIYPAVVETLGLTKLDDSSNIFRVFRVLTALMLTNVFSTPIVYFVFNTNFRVSNQKH